MRRILLAHAARYPAWALDDLYKLLHQAALGSEHAVTDEIHARAWLTRELQGLADGPSEPLIDPISPDGQVLRIHLRPFVQNRLDPELLLVAFIQTARQYDGSTDCLLEYAQIAIDLARAQLLPFAADEILALIAARQALGFPAVHHSVAFEAAYRPAYRVVSRACLPSQIIASTK